MKKQKQILFEYIFSSDCIKIVNKNFPDPLLMLTILLRQFFRLNQHFGNRNTFRFKYLFFLKEFALLYLIYHPLAQNPTLFFKTYFKLLSNFSLINYRLKLIYPLNFSLQMLSLFFLISLNLLP